MKFNMNRLIVLVVVVLNVLAIESFAGSGKQGFDPADTIRIGNQVWMKQNLAIDVPNSFWYDRDSVKYHDLGKLYYFSAALMACPNGWHIPSDEEWQQLFDYLGGDSLAIDKILEGGSSGLNLTLAGYRSANSSIDLFGKLGEYAMYWTSTIKAEQTAYGKMFVRGKLPEHQYYRRANAFSVRLIKD